MSDGPPSIDAILRADPVRWRLLDAIRSLSLSDGWAGAGFVRDAVWDHLHGRAPSIPRGDVDVIWFDPDRCDPGWDDAYERILHRREPSIRWSVKNQARMHGRNGDAPYASAADAMRFWPETATAVAVRRVGADGFELAAPWGTADLLDLILRPTPRFKGAKRPLYEERVRTKNWLLCWPLLRTMEP